MTGGILCKDARSATNTHDISRRSFLCATLSMALLGFVPRAVFASENRKSITLKGQLCSLWGTAVCRRCRINSSTGVEILDKQLLREADRLAKVFGFRPGFGIVVAMDPDNMVINAYALKETLEETQIDGTKGTVLLGRELVFRELQENQRGWGGLAVAGFMAHEFAHIFQFFTAFDRRLGEGSPSELHADFLAGYHLGLKRRGGSPMDIGAFMDGAYLIGDNYKSDPDHHGTPKERRRAVREGYRTGIEGRQPILVAAEIGYNKVQEIMQLGL